MLQNALYKMIQWDGIKRKSQQSLGIAPFSLVKTITPRLPKDDEAEQTLERFAVILIHGHTCVT